MSFVTDSELLNAVAARVKVAAADLPPEYSQSVIAQANASAYQEVLGRLLNRGFTKAQVDQWDRGAEFQLSVGCWLALINSGAYAGFDPETLKALDRRKELDCVLLFINGVWVKPYGDQPGLVTTAGPLVSGGSIFAWPDPSDPRLDEYTHW